jgi:hypothetical protein
MPHLATREGGVDRSSSCEESKRDSDRERAVKLQSMIQRTKLLAQFKATTETTKRGEEEGTRARRGKKRKEGGKEKE